MGPRAHVMEKECEERHQCWRETRLQITRLRRDLTLQEAAREIGITSAYLNMLEMGRRDPSLRLATKIAAYYEVEILDLWLEPVTV